MFESLSNAFQNLTNKVKGKGGLSKKDMEKPLSSLKNTLLQADVALPVATKLIAKIQNSISKEENFLKGITAEEMLTKLLKNEISQILGKEFAPINATSCIMLVGLQGAGKTTTAAKLAKSLNNDQKRKPFMASLDLSRPAAQEQLKILADKLNYPCLPPFNNEKNIVNASKKALDAFQKDSDSDLLIIDTAGRTQVQEELMEELLEIKKICKPQEIIFVADSLMGQEAIKIATAFNDKIGITGIILTKTDGDTKGGAALSIRYIVQKPIKYLCTGEKVEDISVFHPDRIISQMLGQGDLASLEEKFKMAESAEEQQQMKEEMGNFDMNSLRKQFAKMEKMGGISSILGMLPQKLQSMAQAADMSAIAKYKSAIDSMTEKERRNPNIIEGSRKRRIAKGSGMDVMYVNRLLKQHKQMKTLAKKAKEGKLPNINEMGGMGGGGMF